MPLTASEMCADASAAVYVALMVSSWCGRPPPQPAVADRSVRACLAAHNRGVLSVEVLQLTGNDLSTRERFAGERLVALTHGRFGLVGQFVALVFQLFGLNLYTLACGRHVGNCPTHFVRLSSCCSYERSSVWRGSSILFKAALLLLERCSINASLHPRGLLGYLDRLFCTSDQRCGDTREAPLPGSASGQISVLSARLVGQFQAVRFELVAQFLVVDAEDPSRQ